MSVSDPTKRLTLRVDMATDMDEQLGSREAAGAAERDRILSKRGACGREYDAHAEICLSLIADVLDEINRLADGVFEAVALEKHLQPRGAGSRAQLPIHSAVRPRETENRHGNESVMSTHTCMARVQTRFAEP